MSEEKSALTERVNALLADIESLPETENDEQRQVLAGLNEAVRIWGEIAASAEAFLTKHEVDKR